MRRIETEIRKAKNEITVFEASGDMKAANNARARVTALETTYEHVAKTANQRMKHARIRVPGVANMPTSNDAPKLAKRADLGNWPEQGTRISAEELKSLTEYANERKVKLVSFENFDGDPDVVRDFLDKIDEVGAKFPLAQDTRKRYNCA